MRMTTFGTGCRSVRIECIHGYFKFFEKRAGDAADFSCSALTIPELKPLAEKKFMAIGTALSFLHVDLRDGKIRRWKY